MAVGYSRSVHRLSNRHRLSTGPLSVPAFTSYGLVKAAFLSTEAASSLALYVSKVVTFPRARGVTARYDPARRHHRVVADDRGVCRQGLGFGPLTRRDSARMQGACIDCDVASRWVQARSLNPLLASVYVSGSADRGFASAARLINHFIDL